MLITAAVALFACDKTSVPVGPLADMVGEYRIVEIPEVSAHDEALPLLDVLGRVRERMSRLVPQPSIGTVGIAPVIGGDYTEWLVQLDEPAHEYRMLVGSRRSDRAFPVWRFEQAPAPQVRTEGIARLEQDTFIAEFEFTTTAGSGSLLRERWDRLADGRLEFALETRRKDETRARRVGGFIARPR